MKIFGSEYSAFSLAYMSEMGIGKEKNSAKAIELYDSLINEGIKGEASNGALLAATLAKFRLVVVERIKWFASKYF
jgi:TPR repeat protein